MVSKTAQEVAKAAHHRKMKTFLSKRSVAKAIPAHQRDPTGKDYIRAFAARECGVAYVEVADRLYDFDLKTPRPKDNVHDDGTPGGRSKYTPRLIQESAEYVRFRAAKEAPDIDLATATNEQLGQFVDHVMTMAVMAVCAGVKR